MSLEELKNKLEATGLPVAYYAFPVDAAPPLPFICYLVTGSSNFIADGEVYQPINEVAVELYCKQKDPATEALVETALRGIPWDKTETYLDDEHCIEIIYEIEV